ncbi:MAG TPA: NADH-ubiquinone oxidoreductase-F iron-sulfur binding region domain-containing protein [Gaiellaceae bacterium]|nr:NADH-ubiquinone oxidoreductase-F iron-sulfur binding region domain-containing protein [Gaiellaceae bacterium]
MSVAPETEPTTRRLLAGVRTDRRTLTLAEHRRLHGPLDDDPRSLIETLAAAGLRGRGGAGFPTARKLAAVRAAGRRAVVVVNGAEGEPAAAKDRTLLGYVPHLVLDGAVAAARAVRAREVLVGAHPSVCAVVERAIGERDDGKIELQAVAVPDTFVAGEETALVQFLNGGPALPTFTPPRPFERGVRRLPTLVQNAETLAHVALIARRGAAWFRAVGTEEEPGTTLVTLAGAVRSPGVYEIETGQPLSALLADAGGVASEPRAFLVGGYFGTWLPASAVDVPLADAALARYGAALGARAVVVLPRDRSGIAETARILRYLAEQSAGQCGPCVYGLAAVADDFARLARRDGRVDRARLERRLGLIAGRGACSHPDGAVRLAASALQVFR